MHFALPSSFPSCIITKIPIMKILSASQPPSPHFPFPPFFPPAHSLAQSRWRKFIKMKLWLQLTGFIKIYLPLTHCAVCLFAPEDKKDLLNNVLTFISKMLWTHECGFSPKIHLLIYFLIFLKIDIFQNHIDADWCCSLVRLVRYIVNNSMCFIRMSKNNENACI